MKAMVERPPLSSTLLSTFAPVLSSFSYRPLLLHSPHQLIFLRHNRLLREGAYCGGVDATLSMV